MSRKKNTALVLTGVLVGSMLSGPAVHAAEEYFKAYRSAQQIYLDGQQIQLEAYIIGGNNYVKLRDIGEALDFNVYWDGAVRIDSDAPYTGEGPVTVQPTMASEQPSQGYTIHTDYWSREDFSQHANPAIFTGVYDRALYNAMRQTLVDAGSQDGEDYEYAYTMVRDENYSAVKQLMGRLDSTRRHKHHVPASLTNYYEYLDYFAMSMGVPDNYKAMVEFVRPTVAEADRLSTDTEKVIYLNDYLKTLMEYDWDENAGITEIFAERTGEIKGACGSYARAFKVLCAEAGIPCISISSDVHTWNMVYADGQWLHVDVSVNDLPAGNIRLLVPTVNGQVDESPEATEFLKELLVPGSTR